MWIVDLALNSYESWTRFKPMIRLEWVSPIKVPLATRIKMWRKGFLSENYVTYNLRENNPDHYLSDFRRHMKTRLINEPYVFVLENKLVFARMFQDYTDHVVKNLYLYRQKRLARLEPGPRTRVTIDDVFETLKERGKIVTKPLAGGGGRDIRLLALDSKNGTVRINQSDFSESDAKKFVLDVKGCIFCEFVQQAAYARTIFPDTANSIRIVTMWDYDENQPFIAIAVHRFGCQQSFPSDNWDRGGLSATVDLDTGALSAGITYPFDSKLVWHDAHPDSGSPIKGSNVTNWELVKKGILDMARRIPFCPYVGWDVIVTDDGFKVLEGNHYPNVKLIQIHRPLLTDERIRRFFSHHGVI